MKKRKDRGARSLPSQSGGDDGKVQSLDDMSLSANASQMAMDQRVRVLKWLRTYDPRDEGGFQLVVANCLNVIGKTDRVAQVLGVTKSTLNRWTTGDVVPIKMARLGSMLVFEELLKELVSGEAANMKELRAKYSRELEKLEAQDKPLTLIRKTVNQATLESA